MVKWKQSLRCVYAVPAIFRLKLYEDIPVVDGEAVRTNVAPVTPLLAKEYPLQFQVTVM